MVTKDALNMNSYLLCNSCHTEALVDGSNSYSLHFKTAQYICIRQITLNASPKYTD
jgi:hypothetical protein